jgi:hypothetical protein
MANTYTWEITQMDTIPDFNGFTNFITRVYWKRIATNENNISSSIVGYVEFNQRSSEEYLEYNNITEEDVISWLETHTNIDEINSILDTKINDIINPPVVNLPFPWIPSPTPTPTSMETPTPTQTPDVTPTPTPTNESIPTETPIE